MWSRIFLVQTYLGIASALDLCSTDFSNGTQAYQPEKYDARNCGCPEVECIRKCCRPGYFFERKMCVRKNVSDFPMPIYNDYNLVKSLGDIKEFSVSAVACEKTFSLNRTRRNDRFFVQETGGLLLLGNVSVEKSGYCVNGNTNVVVCLTDRLRDDDSNEEEAVIRRGYGMIISMPFLLLTFLVYLIIPEKNLHRKALMFYVICLLLAYVLLVTSNLSKYSFPDVTCHLIGYFIMFFFLGSFLWMNVMCIDMWLTFSGARGYGGTRSTEQKRFLFYCLYAVGVPAMFILFVFLLNTYGDEESIFHPKLGRNKCFLEDGYPQLFYLYLPMATLIGMNIILFILTAIKIQRVKMETAMLKQTDSRKHNYEGDKQQFNLYLKLLFAMGVNWTTEVISWAALWKMQSVPSWIWYLTDLINALYGIFIFSSLFSRRKYGNH
ncbi:unnamed protein product [Acanthoscelides obtectus]|uniref:G-protein coupled receptors family 2 profile 2 domain-containing protein n=1 Tax=Acanthoscelides obtectus TaxID=200917 RepID=A0A9P0Q8D0_ACAOB|nr:unnamed protein product [Acanthoscelides obtectus]CAK1675471.1 G-protein coupled receptor Mth2 [Acanthoscelides obtectus]